MNYAAITAARNEGANLRRMGRCLVAQTLRPVRWVIVDNGSTDDTAAVAREWAASHEWIRLVSIDGGSRPKRGGAVARAFHAGLETLVDVPDVVVKLDADTSFEPDVFERLLGEFSADPRLGMASGSEFVEEAGRWRRRHQARESVVWGPMRAYRRDCLSDVLPLAERMGWDGIDEFKANAKGWRTRTIHEIPYRHHRREGDRDGSRIRVWAAEGEIAYHVHYRPSYLIGRALFRAKDEPAALAMIPAYLKSALTGQCRLDDEAAIAYLRSQQRIRHFRVRFREVRGRLSSGQAS